MTLDKNRKMQVNVSAMDGHGRGLTILLTFEQPTDRDFVLRRMRANYNKGQDDTIRNATLIVE
jgi:hypothetical protein